MSDYIEQFSNEVCNRIGYYVYRLIDPRNGQTFYVGQGKGNRIFAHVNRQVKTRKEEDSESLKLKTIRQINNCGLKVIHVIHRWGLTEKEARIVESAVMDCYPGITNIQSGYQSDKGVTSAYELQNRLSLEEYVEPTDLKLSTKKQSKKFVIMISFVLLTMLKSLQVGGRLKTKMVVVVLKGDCFQNTIHYTFNLITGKLLFL